MKTLILAVLLASVSCVIVPVNGQTTSKDSDAGKAKANDAQPPKINTVNIDSVTVSKLTVQQQSEPAGKPDNDKKESQSYFSRLIAPENLPNLILSVIGIAGIFVAGFTLKHIGRQTQILTDYNKATREMATAMQRPKLEVKWVALVMETEHDAMWRISVTIANVGAGKARVTESDLTVKRLGIGPLDKLLRMIPLYEKKYSLGQFSIEPGERTERLVTLDANTDTKAMKTLHAHSNLATMETAPFVCFGFIRYLDDNDIARLTGFGWQWDQKGMSFTRLDNANYEYTD